MKRYRFSMGLPARKLKEYYRGNVKNVMVTSDERLRLQLPLSALRPYVRETGVYGYFDVVIDENNKLVHLEPIWLD